MISEPNEHGVFAPTEILLVPGSGSSAHAKITIAECIDGWRFATDYWTGASGGGGGIWARDDARRSRRSAIVHGLAEIREKLAREVVSENSCFSAAMRAKTRRLLTNCQLALLESIPVDPRTYYADSDDEEDEDTVDPAKLAAPSVADDWDNRDRALCLVNTSVADCQSSLYHVKDEQIIRRALALAQERGNKTRVQILERELRRRAKASA